MNNTNHQITENHRLSDRNVDVEVKQPVVAPNRHMENVRILNENNKIVRRFSFDDNGGGYTGL
jgi:hypothetical protein